MKKNLKNMIILSSLLYSSLSFGFGLGMTPTNTELNVEAGKNYRQKITVANMGTEKKLAIVVGTASWNMNENGDLSLEPPTNKQNDPTSWVRFSPSNFILEPKTKVEVLVDIAVPLNVKQEEYRIAVLASTILPSKEIMKKHKNVWERYQVASLIYISPSNKLNSEVDLEFVKSDKKEVLVKVKNKGDKHSRIGGNFNVFLNNEKINSLEFNLVLLPLQERLMQLDFKIPNEYKGKSVKIIPHLADNMNKNGTLTYEKELEHEF